MAHVPTRIVVEFEPDAAPITGCVEVGGTARTFVGWTGLFVALRAAVAELEMNSS